jgi:hypothetical protein
VRGVDGETVFRVNGGRWYAKDGRRAPGCLLKDGQMVTIDGGAGTAEMADRR